MCVAIDARQLRRPSIEPTALMAMAVASATDVTPDFLKAMDDSQPRDGQDASMVGGSQTTDRS